MVEICNEGWMGPPRGRLGPPPPASGREVNVIHNATRVVDTMTTLTNKHKPRPPVRVPPLVSLTKDGKRYERPAHVEAEISRMLPLPQSRLIGEAGNLQNETLVFFIRKTRQVDNHVCGGLLAELTKRIPDLAGRRIIDLDEVAREEVVMNVESEIFQVLLTKEQFRDSDYLEIAFGQAVDRLTVEAIRKLGRSPMGHRCQIVANPKDGDSVGIKQLEVIPDDGPSPVDTLLNLEADNRLHQLVHKACDAVEDGRHLKAAILHYGHGVPITSTRRGQKSLQREFRKHPRQIKYWIATALEQMRAALGVKTVTARPGASPRPNASTVKPKRDLMLRDTMASSLSAVKCPHGGDVVRRKTCNDSISAH